MTTKLMTDASLLEAKEQLEAIKAQIEASVVTWPSNQFCNDMPPSKRMPPPSPPPTCAISRDW